MPRLGKKKRRELEFVEWTPFEEAYVDDPIYLQLMKDTKTKMPTIFRNSRYQVAVFEGNGTDHVHLSIKRLDKKSVHDWRELQRIKNEIVGPECEGLELYPAESRLVDMANQYHMFVFLDSKYTLPFGFFDGRQVTEHGHGGTKQRPFEKGTKPPDARKLFNEPPDILQKEAAERVKNQNRAKNYIDTRKNNETA